MRLLLLLFFAAIAGGAHSQKYYLFIGSYTDSGSKGIYVYTFDASTGDAAFVSNTTGVVNPSFLTISPTGNFVYACTETRTANAGSISAFSFDKKSGALKFINKQSSGGDNPVYVSVHISGKWVVCGNYTGGSVAALPINKDGSLGAGAQVIKHVGRGIDSIRQDQSHVHSTIFSPDHDYLFVPDLG